MAGRGAVGSGALHASITTRGEAGAGVEAAAGIVPKLECETWKK